MRKRSNVTKILCLLRRRGLLCRKTKINYAFRKKISHTVKPDKELDYNELSLHIHNSVRNSHQFWGY
jgi:hypothetical protein